MYSLIKATNQVFDSKAGIYSYCLYADNRLLERVFVDFNGYAFDEYDRKLLTLATNIQLNYFRGFSKRVSYLEMTPETLKFFQDVQRNEYVNMTNVGKDWFGCVDLPLSVHEEIEWDFQKSQQALDEKMLKNSLLLYTGGNESMLTEFLLKDVYPESRVERFTYEEKYGTAGKLETDHLVTSNFSIKRYLPCFKKPFNKSVVMFTYLPVLLIYASIIARKQGLKTLLVGDEWDGSMSTDGFYGHTYDQSDYMKLCFQETLQAMGINMQVGSLVANLNTTLVVNLLKQYEDAFPLSCFTPIDNRPCNDCIKCHRISYILAGLGVNPSKWHLKDYSPAWDYDSETLFNSKECQEEFELVNWLVQEQGKKPLGKAVCHKHALDLQSTPYNVLLPEKLQSKVSLANLKCTLSP